MVLLVALAAGVSAMAKSSTTVALQYDVVLNGSHLKAGQYRIQWQTQSNAVTVTFAQKKNVLATATGKLVDHGAKYQTDTVLYDKSSDGSETILELRLAGMSQAIVLGEGSSSE
jgi:siroheme synthase